MKVIITDNAYNDIDEFVHISKATTETLNNYITSLLKFASELGKFPKLGKYVFTIETKLKKYDVHQLIYEQHKILYYVDTAVHIIGIIHTKKDTAKYIRHLKKFINF